MRAKYTNIAIPEPLAKEIDKVISKHHLGYTSRAQFTMEAIRDRILQVSKIK
jgi:metal-responsive CopG/Arc/MetJ family transcriptional regulator